MNKLKCIIADDEPIARQILEGYIKELPNLELIGSCKNAFEVMALLKEKSTDILFLDINMPKLSGLSLLKTLNSKPNVIITTAYSEYAVEGFELAVTDYLLKPFSLERFIQAVNKVPSITKTPLAKAEPKQKEEKAYIFVKSNKQNIKVRLEDIIYVEAYGNYIKIFTDEMILTPQTLSDFMDTLPEHFLRVHKSFAINFDKLKLIEGNQVVLQNEAKIPIGKSYRKDIQDRI